MASVDIIKLGWEDYPQPKIISRQGVFYVKINIPRPIRHLFGTGKGTSTDKKISTGTTDLAIANQKKWSIAHKIYKEFDEKQSELKNVKLRNADQFATDTISKLALAYNYNRGQIPELSTSTEYAKLLKLKAALDGYYDMFGDTFNDDFSQMFFTVKEDKEPWTKAKVGLLGDYHTEIVQSYLEDLLTSAAREQGVSPPVFDDSIKYAPMTDDVPEGLSSSFTPYLLSEGEDYDDRKVFTRERRVIANESLRISNIKEDYFSHVATKYEKENTRRKWCRAVDRFINLVGDLALQEIKATSAYRFADEQVRLNPKVSTSSIVNYHTGISLMLKYCVRKGYIEINPFDAVKDIRDYGHSKKPWLPYERSELELIFSYDWEPRERLLLSIMATTGMRLTEAGSLTWERYNDTEVKGVRYISLIDTNDEEVEIKNMGSGRHVALHPALELPERGSGRLFDYTIDANGLCSSHAGGIINPKLNELVPHSRKSAHSFRRTLKVMLRDAGVSKEVNDIYTGHGSGDVAGTSYGGASIQTRYDAISKLDVSWLKQ